MAEAQVQKGRANLALASPPSLSVAVAALAAVRTDEGSEKQLLHPAAGSKQRLPLSFPCARSTCGLPTARPDATQTGQALRGGLWTSGEGWKGTIHSSSTYQPGQGGQGWLSNGEEVQVLRTIQVPRDLQPSVVGGKVWSSQRAPGCPVYWSASASLLPLRKPPPTTRSACSPYKHLPRVSQQFLGG